jgi:hypothetical protein
VSILTLDYTASSRALTCVKIPSPRTRIKRIYALARAFAAQTEFFAALNAYHSVMADFYAVLKQLNLLLDTP